MKVFHWFNFLRANMFACIEFLGILGNEFLNVIELVETKAGSINGHRIISPLMENKLTAYEK